MKRIGYAAMIWICGLSEVTGAQTPALSQSSAHQMGVRAAQEKTNTSASVSPHTVPHFQNALPPESHLRGESMGTASLNAAASNDVAIHVAEQSSKRQSYRFDPETDPIFINADKAISDPQKTLSTQIMAVPETAAHQHTMLTCTERGEEYIQHCHKYLEIDIEVRQATYKKEYFCDGHSGKKEYRDSFRRLDCAFYPFPHGKQPRLVYTGRDRDEYNSDSETSYCHPGCRERTVIDQPKSVTITREAWMDHCQLLESLADQGLCQCIHAEQGPKETRTIQGEAITRDHWHEAYSYRCAQGNCPNTCEALRAKGCVEIQSECLEKIGAVCTSYRRTYQCSSQRRKIQSYKASGTSNPFCLTGDCYDMSYEDNAEMLNALSHLNVLKEAQNDIRANIGIFQGQVRSCRKHAIGFSDCCTTGGWGQSLNIAHCSCEEKELAQWRSRNRCVLVGTYCAEKILGKCLRKKTTFCCFGNKLSRLIQESGRHQLGLSFGAPDAPDCRGLTPDELSRLDLSQVDLSELYSDIQASFKAPSQSHLAKGEELERIRENMKHLTSRTSAQSRRQS